jgi:hypothetical protein
MVVRLHGATNNLSNMDLGRHLATEDVAKKDIDLELSTMDIALVLGLAACSSTGGGNGSDGASGTRGAAGSGGDEEGGSVAIDDQGRIVVAGSSRVGDPTSRDRYGVVARLMP